MDVFTRTTNYIRGESFSDMTDSELVRYREELREYLLDAFPDIEGPDIAEAMDDALSVAGFDFDRI